MSTYNQLDLGMQTAGATWPSARRWPRRAAPHVRWTIGRIIAVSHHLHLLLGVIELSVLCAFICRVGHSDAQIRVILLYNLGVCDLLSSLRKCK